MSLEIRPTVPEDVGALVAEPLPFRIKGKTAVEDGRPIAFGGLACLPGGGFGAFLHGGEHAKRFPVSFHKAVLKGLAEARAAGIRPITALADETTEAAERWLLRLGFEPMIVDGTKVFVWR